MSKTNSKKKYPGVLISLEGGEGAGKTTQAKILANYFISQNLPLIQVREPGTTILGTRIRSLLLDIDNMQICPQAEALLFQASRAELYTETIIPALQKGQIILMDRTSDSSLVYQGVVRGLGLSQIRHLNKFSTQNIIPDLTILLDIKPEIGLGRIKNSGQKANRIDRESLTFHRRVRTAYRRLAQTNDHSRWQIIDASQSQEIITSELIELIKNFLISKKFLQPEKNT